MIAFPQCRWMDVKDWFERKVFYAQGSEFMLNCKHVLIHFVVTYQFVSFSVSHSYLSWIKSLHPLNFSLFVSKKRFISILLVFSGSNRDKVVFNYEEEWRIRFANLN